MNGTKPEFLKNVSLENEYFEKPDPYKNQPSCNVNLLEMSRYAKRNNKKLTELTAEEVKLFAIQH